MKAKMSKKQDVVVVSLSGRVEVENAEPFRHACLNAIPTLGKKIVFNMSGLSFVGSNGITPFVRAIVELTEKSDSTLKFCEVGSEFQKIFAASPLHIVETFESEERALASLLRPAEPPQTLYPATAVNSNPTAIPSEVSVSPATVEVVVPASTDKSSSQKNRMWSWSV